MTAFAESEVEDATLAWFEALGYAVLYGTDIAVEEPAAEERMVTRSRFTTSTCLLKAFLAVRLKRRARRGSPPRFPTG